MAIPFTANISFFQAVITSPGHFSEPGQMKKKNSTPTPHDATFRQFLTQPDIARDFMEIHLPAELRAVCDLSTLKLESGSFVEDDLRQYFSDVLYSLKTTAGDGYIHVLSKRRPSSSGVNFTMVGRPWGQTNGRVVWNRSVISSFICRTLSGSPLLIAPRQAA